MTPTELLAKYPYDPNVRPQDFPVGSPERLRGVPPDFREGLAILYCACLPRWQREETKRRADELRRQHQPLKAQSREHLVDDVWPYGDKP